MSASGFVDRLAVASTISLGRARVPVDCVGTANIWIDEDFTPRTLRIAQEIVVKALCGTAPGDLELAFFDYSLRGVAAPFSSLSEAHLLRTLLTERDLTDYIASLKRHIQGVRNVMQGREESLVSFRRVTGRAVESYRLVVICADMYLLDDRTKEDLSILLSAGPGAGVSFLIVSPSDAEFDFLKNRCVAVDPRALDPEVSAEFIVDACEELLRRVDSRAADPVLFSDVEDLGRMWYADSTDGVTFSVGRFGLDTVRITMGSNKDQRHNALVTGAVGQGKSNLIAVIVHSLCQRYSPLELELYLLDFKEGVTLQAYSNVDHEEYLPHARALGLEADVDFGIAVLNHLFAVYERRMRLFKRSGVQNLKQYREKTGEVVSRIVVVIDEFQMMLEEKGTAKEVVDLLSRSTRLFRAAGIHFILASQTIASGVYLSKDSDIFAQTPIRLAHRNSVRESEATLGMGNTAAADLRMGEAIANLDYGAVASNRKVQVAWADDALLARLRHSWWERAKSDFAPPSVFDGSRAVRLDDAVDALRPLRGKRPQLLLGKTISVDGAPLLVDFANEPGRNLAVFGAGEDRLESEDGLSNAAIGMVEAAVFSLAWGNELGNAEFVICDLCDHDTSRRNHVAGISHVVESLGLAVQTLDAGAFLDRIRELYAELPSRGEDSDRVYLVCLCMEKAGSLPPEVGRLAKDGPARGVHLITWWQKASSFDGRDGMGLDGARYFDAKVLLRLDETETRHLLGPFVSWGGRRNRALVSDSVFGSEPATVIPYLPLDARGCEGILSGLV